MKQTVILHALDDNMATSGEEMLASKTVAMSKSSQSESVLDGKFDRKQDAAHLHLGHVVDINDLDTSEVV